MKNNNTANICIAMAIAVGLGIMIGMDMKDSIQDTVRETAQEVLLATPAEAGYHQITGATEQVATSITSLQYELSAQISKTNLLLARIATALENNR